MHRFIQGLAFIVTILFTATSYSEKVIADILETNEALAERVLGDEEAPLTIIEYSSLGCSHCRMFHQNTFPTIKKEFIDTGKVQLIFRDFPLGPRAMAVAMVARCAPETRYFGIIELFFKKQQEWSHAEDVVAVITRIAKLGGMGPDDVKECLENQKLLDGIRTNAEEGQVKFEIDSTPSFLIGGEDGEKIEGALSLEEFRSVIEDALK